jgi:UDP-N-acetylglucosamine--N-acetylmuramyl-(pentapeptide) pyrophosphoryl-undecaprenol N-acetylglucosamine transferase
LSVRGTFYIAGGGTGGHLYPGLAIADALVAQDPTIDIMFIGAHRGIERTVLPTTRWKHTLLDLHPLYRTAPWQNWRTIRGLSSALSAIRALARERPPIGILGTGGYAAGALLAYARMTGTPYFIQEQNAVAGLTVKWFSRGAVSVFLGFPESADSLPAAARAHAIDTGNPISPPPQPRPDKHAARQVWKFPDPVQRVVLVFGGSQGSRAVNDAAAGWLSSLPDDWGAIWVTGRSEYERHAHLATDRVRVVAYQQPMADAYACADLAVARAGAMSTAELCAWAIPMVLIPLPTAAADHQARNADALAHVNAARVVPQAALASGQLGRVLHELCSDDTALRIMGEAARGRARPDAAQLIARAIRTSLQLS